ncbi:MAG: hypothetical protein Q8936_16380 [Bacillota bacterium]|nr:hypothetical protein [Bacillota bacterium]
MYKYKKIEMLSLYDVRKKYDREGLAKAAGTDLITMGILTCIVTIVFIIVPGINIFIFGIVFTFIITFYSIKATKELKKYEIQ